MLERALKISENEIRHRARLVRIFTDVPPMRVNESQLGQVCLNLVVNAAQAIPLGSVERHEITVTTGVDDLGRTFFSISCHRRWHPTRAHRPRLRPVLNDEARRCRHGNRPLRLHEPRPGDGR